VKRGLLFISLPDAVARFCRMSTRIRVYSLLLSVFCLTGCIQDSSPSSKEQAVLLLLELLQDERPEMRRTAAESLGKIGDPRAIDPLLALLSDREAAVREAAVLAIGRVQPQVTDGVVLLLVQALKDPAESVSQAAAAAIGEIEPSSRLLGPVVGLLRSSDAMIRRAAVRSLLQVDASRSIQALVEAGHDSDAEVRQGLVAAVGEWGGPAVSPWLRERMAQDPSPGVRAESAYRLGMFSDPETRAALDRTAATDTDSGVRRWAKRGGR
jgi:HEAT repeat protein